MHLLKKIKRLAVLGLIWSFCIPLAKADPPFTIVHVFNSLFPNGGGIPGAVTGRQSSADPQTWSLYGSTAAGGNNDHGIVYKLAPPKPGSNRWTETRLYVFPDTGICCGGPTGQLLFDAAGALYGTALFDNNCSTVFKLMPAAGSYFWRKTTPFTASCTIPGNFPPVNVTSLAMNSGSLYVGIAETGGVRNQLLRLTPPTAGTGPWTVAILHSFAPSEGRPTEYPVTFGAGGKIYGTARVSSPSAGGAAYGSVYQLTPPAAGGTSWSYEAILSVSSKTGPASPAALLYDPSGTIYGTAHGAPFDAPSYPGEVFSLTPPRPGQTVWAETDLFQFNGKNGAGPNSLVRFSNAGPIYGTTQTRTFQSVDEFGYPQTNYAGGAVFELDAPANAGGAWTEKTIALTNGYQIGLYGPLARDPAGALYAGAPGGNLKYNVHDGDEGTILKFTP